MTTDLVLFTIDVETTLNAPEEIGKAHPMWPTNKVVLLGTKISPHSPNTFPGKTSWTDPSGTIHYLSCAFVVGCNLSFDLCYLYREDPSIKKWLQKQRLWDIQLAEYLLSGQTDKWPSLDKMSIKYGFPVKDSKVTEYFTAGLGADKVPKELLEEYLKQDLCNTEGIALKQMELATQSGQLNLIISQMEALHCITEMMFNGLAIDSVYMPKYASEVATEYADTQTTLKARLRGLLSDPRHPFYPLEDVDSALQWSKLLFGGVRKVTVKEAVGVYKNGKPKFKNAVKEVKNIGISDIPPEEEWKSAKTGNISVDEKILETIYKKTAQRVLKDLLETLLKYRELSKQLTTYIQGLGKHIVGTKEGNYIYGRLNQCATGTGRLASSQPNLQNISNNPIKKVFISRWDIPDVEIHTSSGLVSSGSLVEFDFAQLEVAVLAHVSKDKQLIADIVGGKDIHSELYKDMHGKYPTPEDRKWFKRLTFGLIYGAGATTLSKNADCTYAVAKRFIDTFYARYPEVKKYHNWIIDKANTEGKHDPSKGSYDVIRNWKYKTETGRIFVFNEYKSTFAGASREYSFSPTELKNYPVQGLATGDIVPLMLGILFRKLVGKDGVKLVNTVHDSILLDVRDDQLSSTLREVNDILCSTHKYFEETFGIPLALKLSAGAKVGKNWFEMTEVGVM